MTEEELRQKGRDVIRLLDEIATAAKAGEHRVVALQVLGGIAQVLTMKVEMSQ